MKIKLIQKILKVLQKLPTAIVFLFIGLVMGIILVTYFGSKAKDRDNYQKEVTGPELRDSFILIGDVIKEIEGQEAVEISAPFFPKVRDKKVIDPNPSISSIKIYNNQGQLITTLDNEKPVPIFSKETSGVVKLTKNDMGIKLTEVTGFHHTETTIFLVSKTGDEYIILPICTNKPEECSFYNTRGDLQVEDFDNDGLLEVAEIHDEYPPEGGRGRAVLRGIYKYDSDKRLFSEIEGTAYEIFYKIFKQKDNSDLIRASESRGKFYRNFQDYFKGITEE